MRKLFIHIGARKAGSTSLQQALTDNSYKLRASGVRYVNAGRHHLIGPHHQFMKAAKSPEDEESRLVFQKLSEEIRDSDERSFIISSEILESLGKPEELQPFVELKNDLELEIIVLFLVRAHAEQFNSAYVQVVRELDVDLTFDKYFESKINKYKHRYQWTIDNWSTISDRMIVAEFSAERVENILRDELGVSISLEHANRSINPLAIETLRRFRLNHLQNGYGAVYFKRDFQRIVEAVCTCAAEFDSTYEKFWGFEDEQYERIVEQGSTDAAFLKESFGVTFSNAANKRRSMVVPPYSDADKELLEYVESTCRISPNSPDVLAHIDALTRKRQSDSPLNKSKYRLLGDAVRRLWMFTARMG